MKKVIDFYDTLFFPNGDFYLRKTIRKYAKDNIDISIVMKPIVDIISE